MMRVFIPVLLLLSLSMGSMGCTYQGRLSMRRVWADFNTLSAPALYYEKLDHFPYHAAKVDQYRWMYNMGPSPRVPYQEIPEWALDEQGVIVEEYETLPPMDAVPGTESSPRSHPQQMMPRVTPNGTTEPVRLSVPEPAKGATPIEDRPPPIPALPSPEVRAPLQQPVKAPRPQAWKKGLFPLFSRKQPNRPSMMSNQPVRL